MHVVISEHSYRRRRSPSREGGTSRAMSIDVPDAVVFECGNGGRLRIRVDANPSVMVLTLFSLVSGTPRRSNHSETSRIHHGHGRTCISRIQTAASWISTTFFQRIAGLLIQFWEEETMFDGEERREERTDDYATVCDVDRNPNGWIWDLNWNFHLSICWHLSLLFHADVGTVRAQPSRRGRYWLSMRSSTVMQSWKWAYDPCWPNSWHVAVLDSSLDGYYPIGEAICSRHPGIGFLNRWKFFVECNRTELRGTSKLRRPTKIYTTEIQLDDVTWKTF